MRLGPSDRRLQTDHPIVQAPMAGVSTPELAAAVSEAGGLGSIGIGAMDPGAAREAVRRTRALTRRAFNVNLFLHEEREGDARREAAWIARLAPFFRAAKGSTPASLSRIYASGQGDAALIDMLAQERPGVVSFHFGCPHAWMVERLHRSGALLLGTATALPEALALCEAGVDAVVAQGFEAGGHRGLFDENGPDEQLSTEALTRRIVSNLDVPVLAAGGLMDGAGIARVLDLGAAGAQLGTAFLCTPESAASPHYRERILSARNGETVMTRLVSGRPARALRTRFTQALGGAEAQAPAYPFAYDAYKSLASLASAAGDPSYSALWAGTGAPAARALPARDLVAALAGELAVARGPLPPSPEML